MKTYRADLHIHTLLSPCGDLEMSPVVIVQHAKAQLLDMIGITDHNTTRHCRLTRKIAEREGIAVLCGAEVTTREEVHCLAYFGTDEALDAFQQFLDEALPTIPNDPKRFGDQVVIDEDEVIIEELPYLLSNALNAGIDEVEARVHELDGIFIPAHVDRARYSLISQLGFIPPALNCDAMEISRTTNPSAFALQHKLAQDLPLVKNSDAHFASDIGRASTLYTLSMPTFSEVKLALHHQNGRYTHIA